MKKLIDRLKMQRAFGLTLATLIAVFIFEYCIAPMTIPAFPIIRLFRITLAAAGVLLIGLGVIFKIKSVFQIIFIIVFSILKMTEALKYLPKVSNPDLLLSLFVFSNFISVFILIFFTNLMRGNTVPVLFFAFTICYETIYIRKLYDLPYIVLIFIVSFSIALAVIARLLRIERERRKKLRDLYEHEVELGREISLMRRKIIEQEKNFSLSMLTSGIAHELGNPVNYIKGNLFFIEDYFSRLNLMIKGYGLRKNDLRELDNISADLKNIIRHSRSGFENIESVLENMKSIYGSGRIGKEKTDLKSLLIRIIDFFRISHKEEKCTINAEIETDIELRLIPGEFYILISNLLTNALESIKKIGRNGIISVNAKRRSGLIIIKVIDNGCGIPEENLEQVKDPFFSTKQDRNNFGLGLAICDEIIKGYGGDIIISSEYGLGTEISVTIAGNDNE